MRHALLLAIVLLGGCDKVKEQIQQGAPSASTAAKEAPPSSDPGTAPNLLSLVPSKVAVSSTVDNPRDFPEHLMDGKLETAWNSKTGDLGGSIWFRVPADAKVERVDLTVGYEKKSTTGDLFVMNHRIKKVAVLRNNTKLKEVTLDPDKRGWQAIPIGADGGDFRLQILETKPGTKKEWKEIVVSEMRVVGTPGKERRPAGSPIRIVIGNLDATIEQALPTSQSRASIAAQKEVETVCAQYIQSVMPQWQDMQKDHDGPFEGMRKSWKAPFCTPTTWSGTFKAGGPFKAAKAVRVGYGVEDAARLVVQVDRGWLMTTIEWDDAGGNLMGCPSVFVPLEVPDVHVENGFLVATVDGTRVVGIDENTGVMIEGLQRGATWCKDTGTDLTCEYYNPQYQEALGTKYQPKPGKVATPWSALPWKDLKKWSVGADGKLVVQ